MTSNSVSEKRRFRRYDFKKTVKVFPVVPSISGNIYEVHTQSMEMLSRDISEGGLKLEASGKIESDSLLKLNFEVVDNQPVEIYGKVIWTQDNHLGIRFMMPDPVLRKGIRSMRKKNKSALDN